tara:strand:+ start:317 stop:493 length:177 start_codon:yes stop_codon:yes gene_type:complete
MSSDPDLFAFLGFMVFAVILTIGFWLFFFLSAIIPYWLFGAAKERVVELIEERKNNKK